MLPTTSKSGISRIPQVPASSNSIAIGGAAKQVAVAGNYAYVTTEASGLKVVDISDAGNLSLAATYSTTQPAVGVTIAPDGSHVVVTTGVSSSGEVLTLDISDPTNPTLSDTATLPGLGAAVVVATDGFGYVADAREGLQSLLFGQQQTAGSITFGSTIDGAHDLFVLDAQGTNTFSGEIGGSTPLANFGVGGTGITRFAANVTTTGVQLYGAPLRLQADVAMQGSEVAFFQSIDGDQNNLTVSTSNGTLFDGVALYGVDTLTVTGDTALSGTVYGQDIDLQGNLTLIGDASVVAGQTAPNLTAVAGPNFTFSVATPENGTGLNVAQGRGAVVSPDGQLAAISVQGTGVTLWDISDPTNPQNITDTANPILWDAANAAPIGGATATAFSPSGNELYISGYSSYGAGPISFASLDISDPANPTILDTLNTTEFGSSLALAYSVQVTPDGQTAVVGMNNNNNETGALAIIDLSDPSNLTISSRFSLGDVGASNSTESVALSADGRYAFVAGANSKVFSIVDISDPTSPALVSQNTTSTTLWTITSSFNDRYVYAGGDDGISVIDITDIYNPVEVDFESSYFNGVSNVGLFTYGIGLSADGLTLFAGSAGSFTDTSTSVVAYSVQNPADLQFGGFLSQSAVGLTNGGFINRVTNTPDGRTLIFNTFAFGSGDDPADFNFYQIPFDSVACGTVTVAGTIDGNGGNHSLLLETASGSVTVGGEIGGTQPLKDVRVLDQGVTTLSNNVTLTGSFDTLGQLVLGGDTTITADTVIFGGGVEAAGNSLGINTTTVTLDAATNSFSNIANLEVTGAADLCGTIATTGDLSIGGKVALLGTTALSSGAGEINISASGAVGTGIYGVGKALTLGDANQTGTITTGGIQVNTLDIGAGAFDISLNGGANSILVSSMSAVTKFENSGNVTLNGVSNSFFGGVDTTGVANTFIAGCVATFGADITLDNVTLLNNSYPAGGWSHRFDTRWTQVSGAVAGGANISISNLKANTVVNPKIEFDIGNGAPNTITLAGSTESTNPLYFKGVGSVDVTGDATLAGGIFAQNLYFGGSGVQNNTAPSLNFQGNVTLTGPMQIEGNTATFASGLEGSGNDLTIDFTQTATVDGFANVANFTSLGGTHPQWHLQHHWFPELRRQCQPVWRHRVAGHNG